MIEKEKKIYLETYGCQMNLSDSEIINGILNESGLASTNDIAEADVILVNTCSIREHAEQRIYGRLGEFKSLKKRNPEIIIGVLGCMGERLRNKLQGEESKGIGQCVDIIVGPDEYRKLPNLIHNAWHGERGIAVQLSRVETYDDITPLRTNGVSAWISIMRGCDKFCSFCVVPFTRGRERSRRLKGIVAETFHLAEKGYKEITLLGQNVNSYRDGDKTFSDLLKAVAEVDSQLRIRFTTSHPQDMSDELIDTIAGKSNICKYIHLPVQSGSDRILSLMNRNYDTKHYKQLIKNIVSRISNVCISTDIISGFPTETEEDHRRTLDLMNELRFDGAFMFKYSAREHTAAYSLHDDIADDDKGTRINQIINLQNTISREINEKLIDKTVVVLAEGVSRKSPRQWHGRTDGNKMAIFAEGAYRAGDYLQTTITRVNSATLFGTLPVPSANPNGGTIV